MSYRILEAEDAYWRPSNQMGVLNTDLARQLQASDWLGARLWRLRPGQASTQHRHRQTGELYLLLEGMGRIRVADDLHTLQPLGSLFVGARNYSSTVQRHRRRSALVGRGRTPEPANTLELTPDDLAFIYPDGPKALPPELQPGTRADKPLI